MDSDAIFFLDETGSIDFNHEAEELLGASREQLLNKMPFDFSPKVQPDGSSSRREAMKRIRRVSKGLSQVFEWQHRQTDGTLFDAEVSLNRVELNEKPALLAIVHDITDRKRAEEELFRAHEELESRVEDRTEQKRNEEILARRDRERAAASSRSNCS